MSVFKPNEGESGANDDLYIRAPMIADKQDDTDVSLNNYRDYDETDSDSNITTSTGR